MNFTRSLFFFLLFSCVSTTTIKADHIDPHGYWVGKDVGMHHCYDPHLALALVDFFKSASAQSVVDFGCGMGDYVKFFQENQINTQGFDGNPSTPEITKGRCGVIDLSRPFNLNKKFDWVMSLEVGEHLPQQYERVFIENLMRHCKTGIVLSWAVKNQGGYGHFNEQNNDYIKKVFAEYGYTPYESVENHLRANSYLPWFKNTVMVFLKGNK